MGQGSKLILVAGLLGLITSILVYMYVGGLAADGPKEPPMQMADVVVARADLAPRTVVTPDMLTLAKVPLDTVHPNAAITFNQVNGRVVKSPIVSGEQVLTTRLVPAGEAPSMAFNIPVDRRAVTVSVNEVVGVAGFVQAGDRVDVISNFEDEGGHSTSVVALQNIPVLAIAQTMDSDLEAKPRIVASVTLAVTLTEAQKLALAESKGSIRLALRPNGALAKEIAPPVKDDTLFASQAPAPKKAVSTPRVVVKRVSAPEPVRVVEVIRGVNREVVTVAK